MNWRTASRISWRSLMVIISCGAILSLFSLKALNRNVAEESNPVLEAQPAKLSQFLQQQAESITMKVLSGQEVLGSGFIIRQQGSVYLVVTNHHVLRSATPPYQIQTPDDKVYPAEVLPISSFENYDLALLRFQSQTIQYEVASTGTLPQAGEQVFAAGFPFRAQFPETYTNPSLEEGQKCKQSSLSNLKRGFVFCEGKITQKLDQPLEGGYQIGYTNNIEKGMSGGPLLNNRGEVVSINGMHAYPLWGDPYIYMNGSQPPESLKEELIHSSWGIPIETYQKLTMNN